MSLPFKYKNRRDENEKDIVTALESIGCTVYRLDQPLDLLCGYRGRTYLLEVKNPDKPKKDRQPTESQRAFFNAWKGQADIVETAEAAISVVTWER